MYCICWQWQNLTKNVEEKGAGYVLPSGVYFVMDKKVTYIFSKCPKMAFRGKILKIWGHFISQTLKVELNKVPSEIWFSNSKWVFWVFKSISVTCKHTWREGVLNVYSTLIDISRIDWSIPTLSRDKLWVMKWEKSAQRHSIMVSYLFKSDSFYKKFHE